MKIVIKNCPAFCDSTRQCRGAYDRKISHQYCSGNNAADCLLKQIVELCKVNNCLCDNCDGAGYFDGCKDTDCSFYRLMQIETLLEIEEVDG